MTLIFVRHGESQGNLLRVAQGWLDYPLTEKGRRQAAAVAARLAPVDVAAVYSSDLSRASETGEIVAAHHDLAAERRASLREQRFGEREGLTWAQVVERWGEDVRIGSGRLPGEESTAALRERVAREFDLLAEQHRDELAICVSHGGTIRAVIAHVLGLPPEAHPRVHLANGSMTVVETERGRPLITSLNDDCHFRSEDG